MDNEPQRLGREDVEEVIFRRIDPGAWERHSQLKRDRKDALRHAKVEFQRQRMFFWRGGRMDKVPELEAKYEAACARIEVEFAERVRQLLANLFPSADANP